MSSGSSRNLRHDEIERLRNDYDSYKNSEWGDRSSSRWHLSLENYDYSAASGLFLPPQLDTIETTDTEHEKVFRKLQLLRETWALSLPTNHHLQMVFSALPASHGLRRLVLHSYHEITDNDENIQFTLPGLQELELDMSRWRPAIMKKRGDLLTRPERWNLAPWFKMLPDLETLKVNQRGHDQVMLNIVKLLIGAHMPKYALRNSSIRTPGTMTSRIL